MVVRLYPWVISRSMTPAVGVLKVSIQYQVFRGNLKVPHEKPTLESSHVTFVNGIIL